MNFARGHTRDSTIVGLATRRGRARARPAFSPEKRFVPAVHRLEVRAWPALARTRLTLSGRVDASAIKALTRAIDHAQRQGHEVSLELSEIVAVVEDVRDDLMAVARRLALAAER